MAVTKERRQEVIKDNRINDKDTGSAAVQVGIITERINDLTKHFEKHKKDHHSRRGLMLMVSRRNRLLKYMRNRNYNEYKTLIDRLKLRK
jgi:small subunit ribosomal protein S15